MRCVGFPPFIDDDSEILILGSFPSVKSRETSFYYGNDRNRFWTVLSRVFSADRPNTNDDKKLLLKRLKIALWDMVVECDIEGSMDTAIKNAVAADIKGLIETHPKIRKIITNGKTAHKFLTDNFPEYLNMTVCLPSTSPANPRFSFDEWEKALK